MQSACRYSLLLLLPLSVSGNAHAQSTVGELMDAGGHQLEQSELISLLSMKFHDPSDEIPL